MADNQQSSFTGRVEVRRYFSAQIEFFEGEIFYRVDDGTADTVEYLSVAVDREEIPLKFVSRSSLIRAHAKHMGHDL